MWNVAKNVERIWWYLYRLDYSRLKKSGFFYLPEKKCVKNILIPEKKCVKNILMLEKTPVVFTTSGLIPTVVLASSIIGLLTSLTTTAGAGLLDKYSGVAACITGWTGVSSRVVICMACCVGVDSAIAASMTGWDIGEMAMVSANLPLHFVLQLGHSKSATGVCLIFHVFSGWSTSVPHFVQLAIFIANLGLSYLQHHSFYRRYV